LVVYEELERGIEREREREREKRSTTTTKHPGTFHD
jgi:gamma-glutamylcysteine synthetase